MAQTHLGMDGAIMEANCYFAVNSEKTIFMKHEGKHFIIHGLFVDAMMDIATNYWL